MTFLALLCLNILLGLFVPYVLINAMIVNPLLYKWRASRRKVQKIKPPKVSVNVPQRRMRRAFSGFGSTIGTAIFGVFFIGVISALAAFTWWLALPNWLDTPSAIVQHMEKKTGTLTDIQYEWETGSSRSWGYSYIKLGGERYKFESLNLDSVSVGDTVTFHYLKHSKYIMKITDTDGDVIRHTFSYKTFMTMLLIYATLTAIYLSRKRKRSNKTPSTRRQLLTTISFHTISFLIMVLFSFTTSITPLFVVLLVHGLMHYLQMEGGIRANIA